MQGNNTISGSTDIGNDGNIKIEGNNVVFNGTVDAGSINMDTANSTDTAIFKSNVSLADKLEFTKDGKVDLKDNLTGNVTSSNPGEGTLTTSGTVSQTITGTIGSIGNLKIENGTGRSTTVNGNINSVNTNIKNNSTLELGNNSNITSIIEGPGALILKGNSIVDGTVGGRNALKDVNSGVTGTTSTFKGTVNSENITNTGNVITNFKDNVTATNVNVNAGISNFEKALNATTTTITSGTGNFNTLGGTTQSDIVFTGTGTANLDNGLIGNIVTNSPNTGIVNFAGDGKIDGIVGWDGVVGNIAFGIKELNVNTEDKQNKDSIVPTNGLFVTREIFADIINLRNNATLVLDDAVNITNTGVDKLVIATDSHNKGNIIFEGNSKVVGEVGTDNKNLESISINGASDKAVTFENMVYAKDLKYNSDGTVVLNGQNDTNSSAGGFKGNIDFNSNAASLEIGDNVNITSSNNTTKFANANNATLKFNGNSEFTGVLGGNTPDKSTFKEIQAGKNNGEVTFKNDVYALEKLLISNGTVNLEENLYSNLEFDKDGIVNV